jgi:hypothetical protein
MKHVKLFESYADGNVDSIPPKDFNLEVEKIMGMDPVEGALLFQKLMGENFKNVPPDGLSLRAIRKYTDYMTGLDPMKKEEIKKALASNRSITNLDDAEKILLNKVDVAKKNYKKIMKDSKDKEEAERNAPFAAETARKSIILDKFAAGEITKEEALAAL